MCISFVQYTIFVLQVKCICTLPTSGRGVGMIHYSYMQQSELSQFGLPEAPGVYFFVAGDEVLYIGKATSLRDRVRSYFAKDLIATRGPHIVDMVFKADKIEWQATDSVLEALLLEVELIKKKQPRYNTKERDDKSFLCVVVTDEVFPRVLLVRKKDIDIDAKVIRLERGSLVVPYDTVYGPYPNGSLLRSAMRILRKLFPFRDSVSLKKDNQEFYRQIGLLPDTSEGEASIAYKETIRFLKLFFAGKKREIVKALKQAMDQSAQQERFERAAFLRNQIYALEHIRDVSLIAEESLWETNRARAVFARIEGYDVAHTSGQELVGVLTVAIDGNIAKDLYRRFILDPKIANNDTRALGVLLERRFGHLEWPSPELIVVDGSTAQIRVAERFLKERGMHIPVVGVTKDERHKPKEIRGATDKISGSERTILLVNAEAHRTAIRLHRTRRQKRSITAV
jgi:excinuclease ABC subunit C